MDFIFIFGAKYLWVISGIIVLAYFVRQPRARQRDMIMYGALVGVTALVLAVVAGHIYNDPRPFVTGHFQPLIPHGADNGFPSDHTLITAAAAVFMTAYNRRLARTLWIIALIVGISRVYVGVHHIADIVGAIVICIVAAAVAKEVRKKFDKKHADRAHV